MLSRLLPLLLFVACARAPDMATCKLVGTWEQRLILPPEMHSPIPSHASRELVSVSELALRVETFGGDGRWSTIIEHTEQVGPETGVVSSSYFARSDRVGFIPILRPMEIAGEWRLLRDTPTQIEVEIRDPRRSEERRVGKACSLRWA